MGASFGSFASFTAAVQKTTSVTNITGTMDLKVYQIGGDPKKIA